MQKTLSQIFGENVKKYREQAGLTQEQLAENIGVEVRTLSRIECGDQGSTFAKIEKISETLKVDACQLFDNKKHIQDWDPETLDIYEEEISFRVTSGGAVKKECNERILVRDAKTRFDRNRNQVKDELAPLRIQALSKTFRRLLEKHPNTDPGILWGNIQSAHIELLRRSGKNPTSANQSWVKSSGTAFEFFVQNLTHSPFAILKPKDFTSLKNKIEKNNSIIHNSEKLIGRSEDDMLVVYKKNNSYFLTGVIQAKTSIRDRIKMDMLHSKHMIKSKLWSAFITIDPDGFLNKPKFRDFANGAAKNGVTWHGVYAFSHTVNKGLRLHDFNKFIPHLIEASESVIKGSMNTNWKPISI
jgi:transcriptional regulator with XRE-family HTH domain